MITQQQFNDIINYISDEVGIEKDLVLSKCRRSEVVDARVILIKVLHDRGCYNRFIADKLNVSTNQISYSIRNFDDRMKYSRNFKLLFNNISKNLQ